MKGLEASVTDDIAAMQRHWETYSKALTEFQKACVSQDWPAVETAREAAITNLELFMDALAAAHRRIEAEPR